MKIFHKDNLDFVINVSLYENSNGELLVWTDNIKDFFIDVPDEKIVKHQIEFRMPTFSDLSNILETANMNLHLSEGYIDSVIGVVKFIKLVKSWSFLDADNQPVIPDSNTIADLHPNILSVVVKELNLRVK